MRFQPFLRFYYGWEDAVKDAIIAKFQPFLRFYGCAAGVDSWGRGWSVSTLLEILLGSLRVAIKEGLLSVSTLLEILHDGDVRRLGGSRRLVSTLLEILPRRPLSSLRRRSNFARFQPFLRFYRSCWAVFRVFKFFGSFLEPRRPPSNPALHSRMTALGGGEAPFFGVARDPVDG